LLFGAIAVLHWVRRVSRAATVGTMLDLACVAVLAYVVSWKSILSDTLLDASGAMSSIDTVTLLATPALGTLLLVGVVTVLSQVGREELRGSELLATFGLGGIVASVLALVIVGADAGGLDEAWREALLGGGGMPVTMLGWVLGIAAIGFGGAIRRMAPEAGTQVPLVERSTTWELLVSIIPFALLGCVLATTSASNSDARMISRELLGVLGGLLLLRCTLVAVNAVRSARTSDTDHLTSALSHRQFQERLPDEVTRALGSGRSFALLVFDVDDLALLNDAQSHADGDVYLREIAWTIRSVLGPDDLLFRNGGDEFAIALPGRDREEAQRVAQAIVVATRQVPCAGAYTPTLTMGIAVAPADTQSAAELVQLANGTLYWGKLAGKDSITVYDPEVVKVLSSDQRLEAMERTARLRAVLALARALDARDAYTARHSENVSRYSTAIAIELGWAPERLELLRVAGLLHDVGKIGVRDSTLRKVQKLTAEEWAEMQQHPVLGARMVAGVAPEEIVPWIVSHHERFDGTGYPERLGGENIPDGARVLAVADTFDAMTSSRSYRPALSPLRAIDEIVKGAGDQFDPDVVRAFLKCLRTGGIDVRQVALDASRAPAQDQHDAPVAADDSEVLQLVAVDPEFQRPEDVRVVDPAEMQDDEAA
ncbi:MAG: diguanylate cyclase, partial [Thermoleophilia bacterium]|nr:diguanylate cyclase [Thermoleophilia bacterium]